MEINNVIKNIFSWFGELYENISIVKIVDKKDIDKKIFKLENLDEGHPFSHWYWFESYNKYTGDCFGSYLVPFEGTLYLEVLIKYIEK